MKNRIIIIIPYFGKWPVWFDLYLKSCAFNNFIDWYFFTDCTLPDNKPDNVFFEHLTFEKYCDIVSEKLNIDFHPQSAYKLCGLKPFYGYIHADIIECYEFWGFGDVDAIWGDMKKFYTDKLLSEFDVFSTHADRISGHLTIIRNQFKYTKLCFEIPNWKEKLLDNRFYPLDEQEFSWLLYPESRFFSKVYAKLIRKLFNWRDAWVIYYSIMKFANSVMHIKRKNLYFKEQHTTPILYPDGLSFRYDSDSWEYRNGEIINAKTGKSHMYLHFMIFKPNSFREDYIWRNIDTIYRVDTEINDKIVYIDRTGFHF